MKIKLKGLYLKNDRHQINLVQSSLSQQSIDITQLSQDPQVFWSRTSWIILMLDRIHVMKPVRSRLFWRCKQDCLNDLLTRLWNGYSGCKTVSVKISWPLDFLKRLIKFEDLRQCRGQKVSINNLLTGISYETLNQLQNGHVQEEVDHWPLDLLKRSIQFEDIQHCEAQKYVSMIWPVLYRTGGHGGCNRDKKH